MSLVWCSPGSNASLLGFKRAALISTRLTAHRLNRSLKIYVAKSRTCSPSGGIRWYTMEEIIDMLMPSHMTTYLPVRFDICRSLVALFIPGNGIVHGSWWCKWRRWLAWKKAQDTKALLRFEHYSLWKVTHTWHAKYTVQNLPLAQRIFKFL